MKSLFSITILISTWLISALTLVYAETPLTRVVVTIENLAPNMGTFQTPFWVALHDGNFDIYDRDQPADFTFPQFPDALERLAEDGTTSVIASAFFAQGFGMIEATLPGPEGPVAPGDIVSKSFLVDPHAASNRYFSYASMIIPSNDAFVANGNPIAHEVFDQHGNFVGGSFFITGAQVLDAGTEVNDEIPANTAFLGQAAPNTGADEQGAVVLHQGFNPLGSGGILDVPRFAVAAFTQLGYPVLRVSLRAEPAVVENRVYKTTITADQEVPPSNTRAFARAVFRLLDEGSQLNYKIVAVGLDNVSGLHLHLGAVGDNGPVIVALKNRPAPANQYFKKFRGKITSDDLSGPLKGAPLDVLAVEIAAGNVYVNIHTDDGIEPKNTGPGDFATGEIRGQLGNVQQSL